MADKKEILELMLHIDNLCTEVESAGLPKVKSALLRAKAMIAEEASMLELPENISSQIISLRENRKQLIHLVYISRTNTNMSNAELLKLLKEIRTKNKKLGITGLLVYGEQTFIQVLEGHKDVILRVFARITEDHRHQRIRLILQKTATQRVFQDWSMGFRHLKKGIRHQDISRLTRQNLDRKLPDAPDDNGLKLIFQGFYESLEAETKECALGG